MNAHLAAVMLALSMPLSVSAFNVPLMTPCYNVAPAPPARAALVVMAPKQDADGNAIKAAKSGYMFFCAERRPSLTTELKASLGANFKQPAVMKALGAEWGALDDSAKAPFVGLAAADKERYEAAVTSNPANTKPVSKGPRKMSAYMHFCKERRPALTTELKASMGSTFKNTAVMVALGAEWKKIDASSKAKFQALAEQPIVD